MLPKALNKPHPAIVSVLFGLVLLVGAQGARAQDANYWTNQYGNQARILGGLVIGSSDDLSSVYYNPGLLGLVDAPQLIVAGNVVQYTSFTIQDALGDGFDLSNSRIGGVPSLFAGEFRFKFLGKSHLAYSFLTRRDINIEFEQRGDLSDIVDNADLFIASLDLRNRMSEYWAGLTWATPLRSEIGVGVSMFLSIRDQKSRFQTLAQAEAGDRAGVALVQDDFDYQYFSLIWKLGLGGQAGRLEWGVTATTPNLGLFGSGTVGYNATLVTQDLDNDGTSSSFIINDFQEGLSATYKSAGSVGAGAAYDLGATKIHAACEYFASLGEYAILDPDPIVTPDTTIIAPIVEQFDSVFNYGFGLEHRFSPKWGGYLSYRTDFSALNPDNPHDASLATWDIYHFAGGATFQVSKSEFTLGAVFGHGEQKVSEGIDLIPDEGVEPLPPQELNLKFRRLTLIIGFSILFD